MSYEKGLGVNEDDKEAVRLIRKSAVQGNAGAQFNLGTRYITGHGVIQDYTRAFTMFQAAAEQGLALAQFNLGLHYFKGRGVNRDDTQSYMWLEVSRLNGYANAVETINIVANKLTGSDVAKAKDLARECFDKKFKGC